MCAAHKPLTQRKIEIGIRALPAFFLSSIKLKLQKLYILFKTKKHYTVPLKDTA